MPILNWDHLYNLNVNVKFALTCSFGVQWVIKINTSFITRVLQDVSVELYV